MKARDVMTTDVIVIGPGHGVRSAAKRMLDNRVSGLPVIGDEGQLVGILTQGDLMRRMELGAPLRSAKEAARSGDALWSYVRDHSWSVQDVMTPGVIAVDEDTPLYRIAEIMEQSKFRRVPVTRGGKLVGIISRADLLHAIVSAPEDRAARGDASLRRAIEARLSADLGLHAPHVSVNVEGGNVVLSGTVETDAMRQAARVAAESLRGSVSVTVNLSVAPAVARPEPSG